MLNSDIKLVEDKGINPVLESSDREVIGLGLDVGGKRFEFGISFSNCMVGLKDIVGVARQICDKISDAVVAKNIEDGERIPCCKGCNSCCSYLVSISSAEVFSLVDDIQVIDMSLQRYFQRNALLASKQLLTKKLVANVDGMKLDDISNWYRNLNLSCPFLFEGGCGIYKYRPLACREHFIKGSPKACQGKRGKAEVVEMPVSVANVLNELCAELEGVSDTSVILSLFQIWSDENIERKERVWPAKVVVGKFVEIFEKSAVKASVCSC